jgi:hypothetical protein
MKRKIFYVALVSAMLFMVSMLYFPVLTGSTTPEKVNIRTKITIVTEMTARLVFLRFNGLSIRDVYGYNATDEPAILGLPLIELTSVWVYKEQYDLSYFRMETTLNVFISNQTVRVLVFMSNPLEGQEAYATVKIYDARGTLIDTFTLTTTEKTKTEVFRIEAKNFR